MQRKDMQTRTSGANVARKHAFPYGQCPLCSSQAGRVEGRVQSPTNGQKYGPVEKVRTGDITAPSLKTASASGPRCGVHLGADSVLSIEPRTDRRQARLSCEAVLSS